MTNKHGLKEVAEADLIAACIENEGSYYLEEGQVAREFSGAYTSGEVKAILVDMLRVSAEINARKAREAEALRNMPRFRVKH